MRAFRFSLTVLILWLAAPRQSPAVVEVPCDFRDGLILLRVHPAGSDQPLTFALDSGAGASVIDLACARRLGLVMGEREKIVGVHTTASAWRVERFAGRIRGLPAPASLLAMDLARLRGAHSGKLDGLLGLDFLRQHLVEVDYQAGRVRFYDRRETRPAGERLELVTRNDALCVRTLVNGAPKLLRLDTGCSSPLEIFDNGRLARNGGSPSVALSAHMQNNSAANVQLGSSLHPNIPAGFHAQRLFRGEDGLLGNGLLARFDVTIDAAGKALFLRERTPRSR